MQTEKLKLRAQQVCIKSSRTATALRHSDLLHGRDCVVSASAAVLIYLMMLGMRKPRRFLGCSSGSQVCIFRAFDYVMQLEMKGGLEFVKNNMSEG